jgi:ketosteroid isomerase-like protein
MKHLLIFISGLLLSPALQANDSPEALQESFMTALRAGDMAGIAACYTEDATSYDVGVQVLHGPEAISGSWGGFFEAYEVLAADLFDNTVETHGDTGIAWGEFALKVKPRAGGDPFRMVGRFTDVSRNVDGTWLYVLDHVSMLPPAPAEEE